jgi:DNA-binding MarR family transcriptional regulator
MNAARTASPIGTGHVDELVTAMLTASRVLVAVSARSLQEVDETVTVAQFRAMVVLSGHGEINLNRLAQILDVNSSSAMRMVDRLLAIELATRRENPDNRRHTLIALSPQGADVVRKVTVRRRREIKKLVSRMHEEHSEALVEALRAFADAAGEPDATEFGYVDEVSPLGW